LVLLELQFQVGNNGLAIFNPLDLEDLELDVNDFIKIEDQITGKYAILKVYMDESIERDTILGDPNILQRLGFQKGDIVEVEPFDCTLIPANEIIIEFATYDSNQAEFFKKENIRKLEEFLKSYFFTEITELFWPELNANLKITINEKFQPNIVYYFNENSCNITLKEQLKSMAFNAILLIDKSKSMTRRDIDLWGISNALENLKSALLNYKNIYLYPNLAKFIKTLENNEKKEKQVIYYQNNKLNFKTQIIGISRLDSVILSILLFFQLKISRGFGEKCAFVIYADEAKPISFNVNNLRKEYIEATEFSAKICDELINKIKDRNYMRYGNTNISNAIECCKKIALDFKNVENSNNPLMILLLTDGKPHPREIDNRRRLIRTVIELKDFLEGQNIPFVLYTLGIGNEHAMDEILLTQIAKNGNGEYHYVSNLQNLIKWYQELAENFIYRIKR